jgi:hypothetical protein
MHLIHFQSCFTRARKIEQRRRRSKCFVRRQRRLESSSLPHHKATIELGFHPQSCSASPSLSHRVMPTTTKIRLGRRGTRQGEEVHAHHSRREGRSCRALLQVPPRRAQGERTGQWWISQTDRASIYGGAPGAATYIEVRWRVGVGGGSGAVTRGWGRAVGDSGAASS